MKSKTNLTKEQKDVLNGLVSIIPSNLKFINKTEKEVFALIYYMNSKHNGEQFTCGYKEFEESCGLHRNTVSRYIELLKCKGYINYTPGYKNHNSDFVCCVDTNGNIVHKDIVHNQQTLCINIVHNEPVENEIITPNIVHNNNATLCTNNNNNNNSNNNNKDNSNGKDNTKLLVEIVNKLDKLISLNDMTNTDSLVEMVNALTAKLNNLTNQVEELKKDNSRLNDRLNKAALVIKSLTVKTPTKQPTTTKPIEVNNKVEGEAKVANGNKHYDAINACIETIKSTNVSYSTKLEATKELQNLVNSGELTDGQVAMCKKWIEPNQQQLSTNQQSESIDNLVETTIAQYKEVYNALTVGDYSLIDTNGKKLLDNINELRQLKKENKLSKECLAKINTIIAINNSNIEEVNEYLNLRASNKLNGTTDQITKESLSEAKKTAKMDEFNVQIEVMNNINQITNNLITKLNTQKYKSVEAEFKIDYDAAVNLITLYDPKRHCGIKQNGWYKIQNELSMHNSNY